MTVESPGATMTGPEPSTGSNLLTSPCLQNNVFHDYANPHPPVMDHCLHTDMRTYASSPNSLLMYEQEQYDMQNSLSGSCNNSTIQLDDFDLKPQFECSENFLNIDLSSLSTFSSAFDDNIRGDPVWSPQDSGLLKLEDVFQVDRSDVIQGPTLAELNCDDSITFFDDIESALHKENEQLGMTSTFWKMQGSASQPHAAPQDKKQKTSTVTTQRQLVRGQENSVRTTVKTEKSAPECANESKMAVSSDSITQCNVDCSGVPEKPTIGSVFDAESKSSLHKLLTEGRGQGLANAAVMPQVSGVARPPLKRSRSPETKASDSKEEKGENVEKKWEEIKQFIHDELSAFSGPEPAAKVIKTESPDVFSPKDNEVSHSEDEEEEEEEEDENEDEGFNSEGDDSDGDNMDDDNWSSDAESVESFSSIIDDATVVGRSRREKRYFWQYNTQSKGPKGKRLCAGLGQVDPHVLSNFEDPVFDMNLTNMKYKHNGKARRGDGNDINPSPRKLFSIGNELKKLNKIINDLTPVSELPVNARPRSRKEKNKLASRACRLKKKAQHEANKVKLFGLNHEHKKLMTVIECIRREMVRVVGRGEQGGPEKLTAKLDKLIKTHLTHMIAGHTTDFVNSVVEKVTNGDTSGGLHKI